MNANARTTTAIVADLEQTGWTEDLFMEVCSSTEPEVFELFEKYYTTFKSVVEFGKSQVIEADEADMDVNNIIHSIRYIISSNESQAAVQFLTQHKELIDWHELTGNESAIDLLDEFFAGLDEYIYNDHGEPCS